MLDQILKHLDDIKGVLDTLALARKVGKAGRDRIKSRLDKSKSNTPGGPDDPDGTAPADTGESPNEAAKAAGAGSPAGTPAPAGAPAPAPGASPATPPVTPDQLPAANPVSPPKSQPDPTAALLDEPVPFKWKSEAQKPFPPAPPVPPRSAFPTVTPQQATWGAILLFLLRFAPLFAAAAKDDTPSATMLAQNKLQPMPARDPDAAGNASGAFSPASFTGGFPGGSSASSLDRPFSRSDNALASLSSELEHVKDTQAQLLQMMQDLMRRETTVTLDGQKVARIVARQMATAMGSANVTNTYDVRVAPSRPGMLGL